MEHVFDILTKKTTHDTLSFLKLTYVGNDISNIIKIKTTSIAL